ncbi:MerR family transcriptional regulator [Microlunatus soli]|uniref:DNA-binding transcriptional regulator, MerR family n=1 Tax=Microlunatus soli TaxID=630515 RepID=A0A1H2AP73_9ACTN|nr:MerR family transcriptional regulator [Microlunatus soli]SDT47694.1 DNA-binding transcriptional regulator, MerR family [Microlunatus soli]
MRIGEAARAAGVSARSLRFYEDQGLIVPGRYGNGYRDFCQVTVDRAQAIRTLLESGVPTRLIKIILTEQLDGGAAELDLDAVDPAVVAAIRDHRRRIVARIATLDERRIALDRFLAELDGPRRSARSEPPT